MFDKRRHRAPDPRAEGLARIDALERDIVLAREQTWTWSGVSAEEIARLVPDVKTFAKAVTDHLRAEFLARTQP